MRTLVERASRWLVNNRRPPLDSQATVDFFRERVQSVMAELPGLMSGREADGFEARRERLTSQGVPEELATRVAVLSPAYALLGIVETAERAVAGARPRWRGCTSRSASGSGCPRWSTRIFALPRDDKWQTMARATPARRPVRRAPAAHRRGAVDDRRRRLGGRSGGRVGGRRRRAGRAGRARPSDQICRDEADLARLSVGLRVVRTLLSR